RGIPAGPDDDRREALRAGVAGLDLAHGPEGARRAPNAPRHARDRRPRERYAPPRAVVPRVPEVEGLELLRSDDGEAERRRDARRARDERRRRGGVPARARTLRAGDVSPAVPRRGFREG